MILPFSTQLNGKPTYFVEKVWEAILTKGIQCNAVELAQIGSKALTKEYVIGTNKPKLHTIREDKNDRWKAGTKIDFFINCRQPSMFRFAPVLPVVSVQEIEVKQHLNYVSLFIDKIVYEVEVCETSKKIKSTDPVTEALVQNDGFDSADDFFSYFNKDFKGKIIHWTDLRY